MQKFVHLDMEAYRDLAITTEAFIRTLEQPEFKNFTAGMALQAYLPDSYHILQEITAWARKRVAGGGSPVKIRIVKGANMEMEQVEAALFDWPLAPFDSKVETDANWKRMVDFGMQPENIKAVRLGIASHNLFDIAYAYLRAQENRVTDYFTFEMIEGMANHVRRTIQETGQEMVVYAPVATQKQFIHAIAYLIRRLDENTGPENFLRNLNQLQTQTGAWEFLTDLFKSSIKQKRSAPGPAAPHPEPAHRKISGQNGHLSPTPNLKMNRIPTGRWPPIANGRMKFDANGKKDPRTSPSKFRWWPPVKNSLTAGGRAILSTLPR